MYEELEAAATAVAAAAPSVKLNESTHALPQAPPAEVGATVTFAELNPPLPPLQSSMSKSFEAVSYMPYGEKRDATNRENERHARLLNEVSSVLFCCEFY